LKRGWTSAIEEGTSNGEDLAVYARTSQTIDALTHYSYNLILNFFSDNLSSSSSSNLDLLGIHGGITFQLYWQGLSGLNKVTL